MTESGASRILAGVHEGMDVVDSSGEKLGTVAEVSMGDPQAATTEGQDLDTGVGGAGGDRLGGLSPQAAAQLTRAGYIRIDSAGLFSGDRYASAEQVAGVADVVRLSVGKDELYS